MISFDIFIFFYYMYIALLLVIILIAIIIYKNKKENYSTYVSRNSDTLSISIPRTNETYARPSNRSSYVNIDNENDRARDYIEYKEKRKDNDHKKRIYHDGLRRSYNSYYYPYYYYPYQYEDDKICINENEKPYFVTEYDSNGKDCYYGFTKNDNGKCIRNICK